MHEFMKMLRHFKTITKHKWYVMIACFRAGIVWQGLLHDLSKYGRTEFIASARYFQGGDYSPIKNEKAKVGYSIAWQHHKGVNKHHWQYWIDWEAGEQYCIPMPYEYLVEMICDWIGAGKAYNTGSYSINDMNKWYNSHMDRIIIHPFTRGIVEFILNNHNGDEKKLFHTLRFYGRNYHG